MELSKTCSCGKVTTITVTENGYNSWVKGELIQRAMPELNEFERETLISGLCFDCQSKMYNKPKPGKSWGELVGNCPVCDCPLWEKDRVIEDKFKCPTCKEIVNPEK